MAFAGRPTPFSVDPVSEHDPIRIPRLIARLTMGGPARHVSHLTRGLASRGSPCLFDVLLLPSGNEGTLVVAIESPAAERDTVSR